MANVQWTKEMDEEIIKQYQSTKTPIKKLLGYSEFQNITASSIGKRAEQLGVRGKAQPKITEEMKLKIQDAFETSKAPLKVLMGQPEFQGMSKRAIQYHAHSLGFKGQNQTFKWTEEVNNLIIDAYSKQRFPLKYLKKHILLSHVPLPTLKSRIYKMGVHNGKINRWLDAEVDIILAHMDNKKPAQIAKILQKKGYNRSVGALRQFMHKHQIRIRADVYTAKEVAIVFKVSPLTVCRWIQDGKLKAKKENGEGSNYAVTPLHIAEFLKNHPFLLEGRRVDVPFIVALLLEYSSRI